MVIDEYVCLIQVCVPKTGPKKNKKKTKKKPDKQGGKQISPNKADGNHGDDDRHDNSISSQGLSLDIDPMLGYTAWSKVSSSDSDWSESETGQATRSRSNFNKVRQSALSCFYWITKVRSVFIL